MNKAFVREPDDDGRAFCPRCGALGRPVGAGPLNALIQPAARSKLGDAGWFCSYPVCEVAYFDQLERTVTTEELVQPVYPKDPQGNLCACFGFRMEDVEADAAEPSPRRIRELLAKSQSPAARCAAVAPDGQCCLPEIRRLYLKFRNG